MPNQQTFSLNYAGGSSNAQGGTNLLGAGDKLEITISPIPGEAGVLTAYEQGN